MPSKGFAEYLKNCSKLIGIKRASFYRYVQLDQLFRGMLALFELSFVIEDTRLYGGRAGLTVALFTYLVFAVLVMLLTNYSVRVRGYDGVAAYMTDTAFFSVFLLLGGDLSHVFHFNFLFVPFCIGLRVGTSQGSPYIVTNLLAFIGIHLFKLFDNQGVLWGPALIWSGFVATFGYFLSRWGGAIHRDAERQRLLRRIRKMVDSGVGVHVGSDYILSELREFLGVESASVVLYKSDEDQTARTVLSVAGQPKVEVDQVPKWKMQLLRSLNDDWSYIYVREDGEFKSLLACSRGDWKDVAPPPSHEHLGEGDPNLTFLTVPLRGPREVYGRLYIRGSATRRLTFDDVKFVWKLVEVIAVYLEVLRLSDKIADDAAEIERQRIALDIHDTIVQPYVAVQMGLSGLRRKLETHTGVHVQDVDRLDNLVQLGITDLRDYVKGLKNGNGNGNHEVANRTLFASVARYTSQFYEATGINVVFHHDDFCFDDLDSRLATELFQMICEGISNARKHTHSKKINVELRKTELDIQLSIADEGTGTGVEDCYFVPKSLSQRAALLGGTVEVIPEVTGGTRITVEIPRMKNYERQ